MSSSNIEAPGALKQRAKDWCLWLIRRCGSKLVDQRTGKLIGRVLIVPWKGRIAIFGLTKSVRVEFCPQELVTYAKQDLAFCVTPEPDYPNVRSTDNHTHASETGQR